MIPPSFVPATLNGDLSPIHYLVAKYCGDRSASRDDALEKMQQVLSELPALLSAAGDSPVQEITPLPFDDENDSHPEAGAPMRSLARGYGELYVAVDKPWPFRRLWW